MGSMGNQNTSYRFIAITLGLILFAGTISGSAPIVFADDSEDKLKIFKELKAKAQKQKRAKNVMKIKNIMVFVIKKIPK